MIRSLLVCAVVVGSMLGGSAVAAAETGTGGECFDAGVPLTVEEQRLAKPVPQEILRLSGFDRYTRAFASSLCAAPGPAGARILVSVQAKRLWRHAVHRAQSTVPADGLPGTDDRPLYWARLAMASALRQWQPDFDVSPAEREQLLRTLERRSRGQDSIDFPRGVKRILVTGFDPFTLDRDIRISNPSGANALALDGVMLQTPDGPARVETAMFPVNWEPFAQGVVEETLLPHLRAVDLFTTVSQGRPERFDVEKFNGRWRGGFPDNNNVSSTGVIPIPAGVPTVTPAPEFVPATLPVEHMVGAPTGRWPAYDNRGVSEIPAGETDVVFRPDGPTPGSTARAGGGGNYLSNEIAYRATLLRDAVGSSAPGGHLHTPVLTFAAGNTTELTDPVFEQNRADILSQARALIGAAVAGIGEPMPAAPHARPTAIDPAKDVPWL